MQSKRGRVGHANARRAYAVDLGLEEGERGNRPHVVDANQHAAL
jgi:hypothetical protein